jgi:predicted RNA-binding protein with TRAM domain
MCPKKRSPRNAKNKRGRDLELPVKVGEEYTVDITETSPNGEGVARIKGYLIFVANHKLGNKVKVKITRAEPMSAYAEEIAPA